MEEIAVTIRNLADSHPDLQSHLEFGPVSESDIVETEKGLGVKLPTSYRAYLKEFAGGAMLGYEMNGIPTPNSTIPDTTDSCLTSLVKANEKLSRRMPAGHVCITSDGGDFYFYLDTAAMTEQHECPVFMYGPGAMGVKVADDFLDFLFKLAKRPSFGSDGRVR